MDIKYFALQDWVESDLILLKDISTSDNAADAFTKVLSMQLFHHNYDTYMGRRVSDYWQSTIRHLVPTPECDPDNKSPCCSKVHHLHHRTWGGHSYDVCLPSREISEVSHRVLMGGGGCTST